MLLVYSEINSPRWKYIAGTLLQEIAGYQIEFTTDPAYYLSSGLPGLNYSEKRCNREEIFISPAGLLSEPAIREQDNQVTNGTEYPYIYPVSGGDLR